MLRVYETFARDFLALPVISGEKTASERFPGALQTLCIEAMAAGSKGHSGWHLAFPWTELLKSRRYSISISGGPARTRVDD